MTEVGAPVALLGLSVLAASSVDAALRLWPAGDPQVLEHRHDNLPLDHPHLKGHRRHSHAFVVDADHPRWALHL